MIASSKAATPPAFLSYGRQTIEDDDVAAVVDALRSDALTTGPRVDAYEDAFARAAGARYAVSVNSGTAALHLAMLTLGVGPGDVVIVPALTFLATANAVRMTGAEVHFADVDPATGLLTAETFADAAARAQRSDGRVVGAVAVHLNGQRCAMPELNAVAEAFGLWLIEDACHALGAVGACFPDRSRIACFSTHPVKSITTAEGGVLVANDEGLAAHARRLRSHGMLREPALWRSHERGFDGDAVNPWYYEIQEIGWNYRLPDVLCALGCTQLAKLPRLHARRAVLASLYDEALADFGPVLRPVSPPRDDHGWHLYAVLIDFAALRQTRRAVMEALRAHGVGSQVHYIPVHRQPYYAERYGVADLPGADAYYRACLSLPLFPAMRDDDVARVCDALRAAVASSGSRND